MVRARFDRRTALDRDYRTMRGFTYNGEEYQAGDPFAKDGLAVHQLQTLYGSRYIEFAPEGEAAAEPDSIVTLAQTGGGYYEVRAAWLDKPLRIRGKAKAEAEARKVEAEGPPLGFIEGGSDVTIEAGDGGWYEIAAPWLDEPEKLQGREAAEQRQRELHDAGEPDAHHGVQVTEGENGWYEIKADWAEEPEKVRGEEAARARAAEVRGEEAARARAAELRAEERPAQLEPVDPTAAQVLVSVDGDKHVVTAPWLGEPESFDDVAAAEARQAELREAGPPEGWTPPETGLASTGGPEVVDPAVTEKPEGDES